MEDTIIVMTESQLSDLAEKLAAKLMCGKGDSTKPEPSEKRYVYGLRGISGLFNVSNVTAQQYKNTFLKPAVMQRGRKIMVDVDMAIELYRQHQSA